LGFIILKITLLAKPHCYIIVND